MTLPKYNVDSSPHENIILYGAGLQLSARLSDLYKHSIATIFPLFCWKLSDNSKFRLVSICKEKNIFIVLIIACAQASRSSQWLGLKSY